MSGVSRTELRKTFRKAGRAPCDTAPEVGLGQLQRSEFKGGVATALCVDGQLAHASLFAG